MKKNLFEMGTKIGDGWNFDEQKQVSSEKIIPKKEHQLVFMLEKRNGKPVTLVGRFWLDKNEKQAVLGLLKKKLSTGGTIANEWIEIQGDMKEKIKTVLLQEGWKFK